MLQHFQFNWETVGYKGNTAIGEIKRWDCFNDSPARKVRSTVNWVSLHSDLTMTERWVILLFTVIICSVKSHPSWLYVRWQPDGHFVSISISQINSFLFQTVVVQDFHLFLAGVWAAYDVLFQYIYLFIQQPQPVIPHTLAWWTHSTSQAASCTSSCWNRCSGLLWNADFGLGSQSTLLYTLIPLTAKVSLGCRGSVKFRCISKSNSPLIFFFFINFSQERLVQCMNSKNTNILRKDQPHMSKLLLTIKTVFDLPF